MNYLGVDLAAKFSAVVVVNDKGKVLFEFDSWGMSQLEFTDKCVKTALEYKVDVVTIEDIPYGISNQSMTKPATRFQGMLIKAFHDVNLLESVVFLNPSTWQREFKIFKKGPEGAREVALKLGFEQRVPIEMYAEDIPPLGKEHAKDRAKIRAQLKKASTDYDDAFLIAIWTAVQHKRNTLRTTTGVQVYKG